MKKLAGLVIVILVLVLGSYYIMGRATENTIKRDLRTLNKSQGVTANLLSYKRSWFCSTASIDLHVRIPEHVIKTEDQQLQTIPLQEYEMVLPLKIHHGPIIFANNTIKFGFGYAKTVISLPKQYLESFAANFKPGSTKPKLNLSLFITYLKNSQIDLSIPAFKLISPQGDNFDWQGMKSRIKLSSHAESIKGDFTVSGFQLKKDDGISTIMQKIKSDYDLHKTSTGLYLGDANISFPSLVITKKDERLFELSKLNFSNNSDINDGLFSSIFKTSVKAIFIGGKAYGPGVIEISIKNLDADTLGRINSDLQKVHQANSGDNQSEWFAILPELPKLLTRGPELELSVFKIQLPEGTVEAKAEVSIPPSPNANLFVLMQNLQGKGKLQVPTKIVKNVLLSSNVRRLTLAQSEPKPAPMDDIGIEKPAASVTPENINQKALAESEIQLSKMLQSGLIVQNSNNYLIEFSFSKGKLLVNSKPFDPAMLKF